MSRRARPLTLLAGVVGAAALVTLFLLPPRPFRAPAPSWTRPGTEVRGVFHIHTRRSDGTGTVDDVAAAAARAGLQFVIVTDHGDGTRAPDPPSFRSGVLCIDAVEISTNGGHYAALGLGPTPYPMAGEPRDVAEDVRRLGGFGVATHPLSEKSELAWRDWDVPFDAIEWLNGDSLWRDAPSSEVGRAAWTYLFRPVASLARLYRRPAVLDRWDRIEPRRRVIALAGTDAHARLGFRDGPEPYRNPLYLKAPSYQAAFGVASLRVSLTEPLDTRNPRDAADALLAAIRAGHVHTVVDGLGTSAAFDFNATSGGASAGQGGQIPLTDPAVVRVRSNPPSGGWLVLFRNGHEVHRVRAGELVYASDQPGIYRAEVWVRAAGREGLLPWIVGNPIVVGPGAAAEVPPAPDRAGPSVSLDATSDMWGVEHDARSRAAVTRVGGVGLAYTLASEGSSQYAALEATTAIDLRATGLSFLGRADRPMRLSVQVRVPTAGEGLRWHRSVYLDATPREVVVPFAEMRAVGETPKTAPRLADVRTILFVVDLVNSKPGSTGHFVLQNVRLYSPGGARAVQR